VVLVPFPFDDLSAHKVRPVVCLTDPVGPHRHVVLAFITSQPQGAPLDSDVPLESAAPDFGATGLRLSSVLRLHRLMTVRASFIQRRLGELLPSIHALVAAKLRRLFGL
jgi:mRNA interferase MazF